MSTPSLERWSQIRALFLRAVAEPEPDRREFVRHQAPSASVGEEVLSLLDAEEVSRFFASHPQEAIGLAALDAPRVFPSDLPAGTVVGRYRIERLLAEGAFGQVYAAQQVQPTRRVALKVLRPGVAGESSVLRFLLEPELLASVAHPCIAQVFEVGALAPPDCRPYFAMELVDGRPITDFARVKPLEQRLRVFAEVCRAVQHAHARGVIHRDLKPSNILVTEDERPKLLDFGVARLVGAHGRTLTTAGFPGQLVGTLEYIAPEYAGAAPIAPDVRADVYSLGVVLFELLSGSAFLDLSGRSLHECLVLVATAPRPRLREKARSLDRDLEIITSKATCADPRERYASVSDLAADVERFLRRVPIEARPPTLAYEIRRLASRNRLASALLAACLFCVGAFVAWLVISGRESDARLQVARTSAELLLNDAMKRLGPSLGTIDTRERIVLQLEDPLGRLLAIDPADPSLRRNAIRLAQAKADIASERGRWDEAASMRADAVERLERLVLELPGDLSLRADLSIGCVQLGDVLKAAGNLDRTAEWYERALEIDLALVRLEPGNATFVDNLCWSYLRLSDLALLRGETAECSRFAGLQLDAARGLVALTPERAASLYALVTALVHRYHVNITESPADTPENVALLDEAVEQGRRMIRTLPEDRGHLHQHGLNCVTAAMAHARLGRSEDAVSLLEEASAIRTDLTRTEPDQWRTMALASYVESGWISVSQRAGDAEGVSRHARECRRSAWRTIEIHASNQGVVVEAIWSIQAALAADPKAGQTPAGREEHRRTRDVLESLVTSASPHDRAIETLLNIYRGGSGPELEDASKALALARRWVELRPNALRARLATAELLLESGRRGEASEVWNQLPSSSRPTSGALFEAFGRGQAR